MNTNARSLQSKIDSLIDNMNELGCLFGIVTETWFRDGAAQDLGLEDLSLGSGYEAKVLNREERRGGGVAILAKQNKVTLKEYRFHNPGKYKILATTGRVKGCKRLFVLVGCYMPPGLRAAEAAEFLQLLVDLLHDVKRKFVDPYIVVAGDYNQFDVKKALEEHRDMKEVSTGPTRGHRTIDRAFTNFNSHIKEKNVIAPLAPNKGAPGAPSDHRVVFFSASLETTIPVEWTSYESRKFSDEKAELFGQWLAGKDWSDLFQAQTSNQKADIYQEEMKIAMDKFFPLTRTKKRSDEDPWVNDQVRRIRKANKALFRREGRTEEWKRRKADADELERTRREKYKADQKNKLTACSIDRLHPC
jgi:hypothetical protein